ARTLLSLVGLVGCQAFSPSVESKTAWSMNEPNRSADLAIYGHPQIVQICMDDGFRTAARVISDRSRTYTVTPGNCIDVEGSTFDLSVFCSADCARTPLGSGTVERVDGILPPRGAWRLGGNDPREVVHLIHPRFYEFCNVGAQPIRLFSE